MKTSLFVAVVASASLVGCVHSTPIQPSPLSDGETAKLQKALMGTCIVTEQQKENGNREKADGLSFTFGNNGAAGYNALGIVVNYKYQVEGRNVLMDGPYKAFRVDDWSDGVLKLFVYDLSTAYFCKKV